MAEQKKKRGRPPKDSRRFLVTFDGEVVCESVGTEQLKAAVHNLMEEKVNIDGEEVDETSKSIKIFMVSQVVQFAVESERSFRITL